MPDFDSPKIKAISADLVAAYAEIDRRTRKFQDDVIYEIVATGVFLLRAKKEVGHGNFLPYLKSATVADLNISERSANRYMAAAENAGLTFSSTAKDLKALRKKKALHGKKPTELYRLPAGDEAPPPTQGEQADLNRDAVDALEKECDQVIALKGRMNARLFERAWRKLKLTLETMTESEWQEKEDRA